MATRNPSEYGRRVKVSNWTDLMECEPKDIEHPKHVTESHYRTFGLSDKVYMPKTSTQECLESLQNVKFCKRIIARSEINFTSYPMNDFRFNKRMHPPAEVPYPPETTYEEYYKTPYAIVKKKDCCKEPLDVLFNRIPQNDFEMLPTSTNKFMDDHLVMISEGRKKINRFRQMRNSSNPFN